MLLDRQTSLLLIVDIQEKFVAALHGYGGMLKNGILLMGAAARLRIPMLMSEQYPQGLGGTVPELRALYPGGKPFEKTCFSCSEEPGFLPKLAEFARPQIVLMGIEAHVCVLQTAVGLSAAGYHPFVVADATASRTAANHALGLERIRQNGIPVVSAEMVFFEWLRRSGTEEFRELSKLVR
ncbi:MAG: hydrolase [Pseudomonadota bacterium]